MEFVGINSGPPCASVERVAGEEGGAIRTGSPAGDPSVEGADIAAAAGITGLAVTIGAVAGGVEVATGITCGSGSLPSVTLKWLGRNSRASRGTSMSKRSPGRNACSVAGLIWMMNSTPPLVDGW